MAKSLFSKTRIVGANPVMALEYNIFIFLTFLLACTEDYQCTFDADKDRCNTKLNVCAVGEFVKVLKKNQSSCTYSKWHFINYDNLLDRLEPGYWMLLDVIDIA